MMRNILNWLAMVTVALLLFTTVGLGIAGLNPDAGLDEAQRLEKKLQIHSEPRVEDYLEWEEFEVVQEPRSAGQSPFSWVVVKRLSDGELFSAMVTPQRLQMGIILPGTKVQLVEVSYKHNSIGFEKSFCYVK